MGLTIQHGSLMRNGNGSRIPDWVLRRGGIPGDDGDDLLPWVGVAIS